MERKSIILISLIALFFIQLNGQLVVKEATNKVGIGTLEPTEKIEMHDGILKVSGSAGVSQQLKIDVEDARAGFSLQSDGNGNNTDDKAVFTMRNQFGDAVFSVCDISDTNNNTKWHQAFKWQYLIDKLIIEGHVQGWSWMTGSDKRLKSNISSFDLGIEELMRINPITFKYNGKAGMKSKRFHVGVLAQELQEIAPEFVSPFIHKQLDENQEKIISEEEYLQIHDNEIKYLLINAIKDLKMEIDDLRAKIDKLESSESQDEPLPENIIDAKLYQNIPNPSQNTTNISYRLPKEFNQANLRIYSISGQIISNYPITQLGEGTIEVDLFTMNSGHYMYSLIVDGRILDTKKMAVTK